MCRLMAYAGSPILAADLLFRPSRSIVRQSFDARERANGATTREVYAHGQLNADGFGLAFYASVDSSPDDDKVILPCVFTETQPAWNSKNLRRLSEKVKAPIFLAHVRAAGPGLGVCDCKTHPFTFGRFSFMHNGEIAGFVQIRRKLMSMLKKDESFNVALAHGATDTAVSFALFLDQLASPVETLTSFAMVEALKTTVRIIVETCEANQVRGTSKLNFVVSDGRTIVATRYTFDIQQRVSGASLYYASGTNFAPTDKGEEYDDTHGEHSSSMDPTTSNVTPSEYRIFHSERRSRMTIVASEPLTEVRSDWVSVPDNHVLVVMSSGEVVCAPFYLRCEPCYRAKHAVAELARVLSYMDGLPTISQGAMDAVFSPGRLALNGKRNQVSANLSPNGPFFQKLQAPPLRGKVPMVRCQSSKQEDNCRTPDTFRRPRSNSLDMLLRECGDAMELRHPAHVLVAAGQVHVSAMVAYGNRLFCADGGAAGGRVCVYDLNTLRLVAWSTHWGILALSLDESRGKMYGSRSDGQTVVWDLQHSMEWEGRIIAQARVCIPRVGHVLSMCASSVDDSVYLGSQDGFVRQLCLPDELGPVPAVRPREFRARDCPCVISPRESGAEADCIKQCRVECALMTKSDDTHRIPTLDIARSHCGFVTSVITINESLLSAGSCGLIKRWDVHTSECVETIGGHTAAVMELALITSTTPEKKGRSPEYDFLSASLDGTIRAWRHSPGKETTFLRSLRTVYDDPLACMAIIHPKESDRKIRVCAGSISGAVWVWDLSPRSVMIGNELPSIMLNVSSSPVNAITALPALDSSKLSLAVGAGSGRVSLWALPEASFDEAKTYSSASDLSCTDSEDGTLVSLDNGSMVEQLRHLVAYQSVSADASYRDECFECVKHIAQLMERVGCETRLAFSKRAGLPCVLGRLLASNEKFGSFRKAVFVYGHYDVVPAGDETGLWSSNPWELSGRQGFLYGRGTSDDKGPFVAMLMGAAELKRQDNLPVNVVFCMEGEGETSLELSKRLLHSVLEDHREFINCADVKSSLEAVVISNNTWVDDVHPCVTYGMRGVVDLEVIVMSEKNNEDLHSGVHGGGVLEPVNDLVSLLHSVAELKELLVANTPEISVEELKRLVTVTEVLGKKDPELTLEGIKARWASPSISVSTIRTSNPDDSFRKVPHAASARVSVYVAPGLSSSRAKALVTEHLETKFKELLAQRHVKMKFGNQLMVNVIDESDPWIGDVSSRVIKTMSKAVETVWEKPALLVREGGSYSGMTAYLERTLGTHAVHLPMAQSKDNAHLHDEHISLLNLANGRRVFQEFLREMETWQDKSPIIPVNQPPPASSDCTSKSV